MTKKKTETHLGATLFAMGTDWESYDYPITQQRTHKTLKSLHYNKTYLVREYAFHSEKTGEYVILCVRRKDGAPILSRNIFAAIKEAVSGKTSIAIQMDDSPLKVPYTYYFWVLHMDETQYRLQGGVGEH
jgi:hypothetical protein